MKMLKRLLGIMLLLPLMGFAASEQISDWGFEPNGDVRVVVGDEALFVSAADEAEYFQTLMAARLGWKVEAMNGKVVVDVASVPADEQTLLAGCATATCVFTGVSRAKYGCMLDGMYNMVVTTNGTVTSWPDKNANSGVAAFTIPNVGAFSLNVLFDEPAQKVTGTATLKPAAIPYNILWGYVDQQLKACS